MMIGMFMQGAELSAGTPAHSSSEWHVMIYIIGLMSFFVLVIVVLEDRRLNIVRNTHVGITFRDSHFHFRDQ